MYVGLKKKLRIRTKTRLNRGRCRFSCLSFSLPLLWRVYESRAEKADEGEDPYEGKATPLFRVKGIGRGPLLILMCDNHNDMTVKFIHTRINPTHTNFITLFVILMWE